MVKFGKYRKLWDKQERFKVEGKISNRVCLLLARCYIWGWLSKPLGEITDKEFLGHDGIGPRTLAEIRTVIPAPQ